MAKKKKDLTNYLTYEHGDALRIDPNVKTVVAHVVSNTSAFGAGFAKAINNITLGPKHHHEETVEMYKPDKPPLGMISFVEINPKWSIVNMIAMDGLYNKTNNPNPLSERYLGICLCRLYGYAKELGFEKVQMPKIGTGLARGNWKNIESLIKMFACIPTTIYTL